jgi:hypothetical protein
MSNYNSCPWAIHTFITGISEEMKKDLPKGLKIHDKNKVKVPENGKLSDAFYKWCCKHGIGNGFEL